MDWSADSMSCVTFTQQQSPGTVVPDTLQAWQRVFSTSPQSFNQLPGGSQASGIVGSHLAAITAQLGRTELALHPVPPSPDAQLQVAGISPFPPSTADVEGMLQVLSAYGRAFATLNAITRVAVLVNLSKQASDPSQASEEFERHTRIQTPVGSSDLTFTYNLPGKLIGGGGMNRIRRWSTATHQAFLMQMMQVNAGPVAPATPILHTTYATLFQIDVNTAPQQTNLPNGEIVKIFDELVSEARSLMSGQHDPSTHSS